MLSAESHRLYHERVDPHRRVPWLVDVLLGGQDGLVNVLGVVLGVAAASESTRFVLAAGFAAAVAESVSMAAVAYTSSCADRDLYCAERAREERHIVVVPDIEREEIRTLYYRRGFRGALLEKVVETITRDPEVWVAVMLLEEHGLVDRGKDKSLRSAVIVGGASLVGSLVPLFPFLFWSVRPASYLSLAIATLSLFAFGAFKGKITLNRPLRAGCELALIGLGAALVGFLVGVAFRI